MAKSLSFFSQNPYFLTTLIAACATFGSSSCGKSGAAQLEGKWETQCQLGFIQTLDFTDAQYSWTKVSYLDSDCTMASASITEKGTFTVGNQIESVQKKSQKVYELNLTLGSVEVMPLSANQVSVFQAANYCSLKNWVENLSTVVTGKKCSNLNTSFQKVSYSVFSVSDNKLLMGQTVEPESNLGSTPESRIQLLGETVFAQ